MAPLIPVIGGFIASIMDTLDGDRKRQAEALLKQMEIEAASAASQSETNREEARHQSVFVSGWRPAVGWVCVSALALEFVVSPILGWVSTAFGTPLPAMPSVGGSLMELMLGMLGLGGMRTFEKMKGVAR